MIPDKCRISSLFVVLFSLLTQSNRSRQPHNKDFQTVDDIDCMHFILMEPFMMKHWTLILALIIFPFELAFANCDLTRFRWGCDIHLHVRPTHHATSLVYCGNAYGYVTRDQFEIIAAYNRADVNMILDLDNEYADSPCIAYRR